VPGGPRFEGKNLSRGRMHVVGAPITSLAESEARGRAAKAMTVPLLGHGADAGAALSGSRAVHEGRASAGTRASRRARQLVQLRCRRHFIRGVRRHGGAVPSLDTPGSGARSCRGSSGRRASAGLARNGEFGCNCCGEPQSVLEQRHVVLVAGLPQEQSPVHDVHPTQRLTGKPCPHSR
jgi:hypothetical protein